MNATKVILFVVFSICASSIAFADGSDFTVISPPASPPLSQAQIKLDSAAQLTPFLGKTIVGVDLVVVDSALGSVTPKALTRVKVGDVLTAFLARSALEEALASGQYGDAWVNVVEEGSGVRVRVHAVPRKLAESVRMDTHAGPIPQEDLLREASLDEGTELVGNDLDVRAARMRALLARRGFPNAVITITTRETERADRIIVLIDALAADPRLIERRVFYPFGATADELKSFTDGYAEGVGDRADEVALDSADGELVKALHAAGYYDALVFHDLVLASNKVTLRVRIDSGPKYTMRFVGNDHYDSDALSAATLAEGADGDHSASHLEAKLRHFYEVRGYLDAEVTTEIRGETDPRVRAFVFHIHEAPRVRVGSRSYPCLKEADIKNLTNGGPTSVSKIGREIDSFLEDELPGADLFVGPNPHTVNAIYSEDTGDRRDPVDLDPDTAFSPATYERAIAHVQDLYRNEGFLSALVGPVQLSRRTCDPRSPAGRCLPIALPKEPPMSCAYDATGTPTAVPPLPSTFTCVPDAAHGVFCEPSVSLRIPVKLGPRTFLYDLAFRGANSIVEKKIATAAALSLGSPVSAEGLDEARRRVLDLYKEEGFAYAEVAFTIEKSPDQTRARIRFDITEGERVIVRQIVIRGNRLTNENIIRRRIALVVGQPYRTSNVRKSQERIATLNVFSSVNVAMANPLVPQKNKSVIVTVVEAEPQYVEPRLGISTGEGPRGGFEYGHRNLFGEAVGFAFRAQLSYLPDFFISDPAILQSFRQLSTLERLVLRLTATVSLPELGLGPLVRGALDTVLVNDVERYFRIFKEAVIPTIYVRPARQTQLSFSLSGEHNDLQIYNQLAPGQVFQLSGGNSATANLLRAPSGSSWVVSQRFTGAYDKRDSALNAHKGFYLAGTIEHADAYAQAANSDGHFVRLSQTVSVHYPVTSKITLAAMLRLGEIIQLVPNSQTYPDRFFFMGGADSMRGWAQDTMFPQDAIDAIIRSQTPAQVPTQPVQPRVLPSPVPPIDPSTIAIRGGNLMINPRVELRFPVFGPIESVAFFDAGNLWQDATYPFIHGFKFRTAAGTGVRVQTPIGPLALDFGFNLMRYLPFEDLIAVNFSIGVF